MLAVQTAISVIGDANIVLNPRTKLELVHLCMQVETPRSSGTHTPTQGRLHEMLQARITRLEERNRAMIADRARAGFGSQQNSPYGTPRGSFSNLHGSQSPFAPFSGSGDAGELKQQNSVLHDEVTFYLCARWQQRTAACMWMHCF